MTTDNKYRVKIADFGLSEYINDGIDKTYYTLSGTPGFIAPEVLKRQPYDYKSDIFSIGSIAHFMMTGKLVIRGRNFKDILKLNKTFNLKLMPDYH